MKHHFPWVAGTMIALAVYLQATGVSRLAGGAIIPDRAARLSSVPPAPRRAPHDGLHATSAEAILRRNPFDSATGPLLPPPGGADEGRAPAPGGAAEGRAPAPGGAAEGRAPTPGGDAWRRDPICEAGRVVLIAASEDAAWSFAAIEGPDGRTELQRLGSRTPGGTIARIAWDRVWIAAGGARCQMRLGGARVEEAPPEPPRPQARPVGGDASLIPPEIAARLQRASATEIHVDRAAVERILDQQAGLLRAARTIPDGRGDPIVGLKLRLRRGSPLETLGLESGDLLRSINGFDVTDPERVQEAHAQLRTASHLSIAIERGGQLMTVDVSVR
ncbi:type II secretion system protein GspC [Sorangium sp. So ce1335]|uniref:type II secretion system protein GspC n=1 Tax=Sorangium sp. So ce1335 TaxID=3133335 RepID=UPI003F5F7337